MKKSLLLPLLVFVTGNLSAQTEEERDSLQNETLKRLEEKIDGFTNNSDSIGYVELTTSKIRRYEDIDQEEIDKEEFSKLKPAQRLLKTNRDSTYSYYRHAYTKIDSVDFKEAAIEIRNGTITSIFVKTKDKDGSTKVFTNSRTFIELSEINNRRCDQLAGINDQYIQICDFLAYIGSRAFPSDTSITFTKVDQIAVHKKTGLNNVFQARLYSDLLGLVGDESNGLVQAEVSYKSNLHNRNVKDSPFYFVHYVCADFGLSRFDSKFRTVNAPDLIVGNATGDDSLAVDYMDLYQQSFVFSTFKVNIFEWFVNRSYSSFALNGITGINAARLQDSLTLPVRRVNMPYWGVEGLLQAKPFDNFGLIMSYSARKIFFYGLTDGMIEDPVRKPTYTVSMEVYWNPRKNDGSRIFARFRYTDMIGPSLPFSQFQVGYAVNFSDWIKAK